MDCSDASCIEQKRACCSSFPSCCQIFENKLSVSHTQYWLCWWVVLSAGWFSSEMSAEVTPYGASPASLVTLSLHTRVTFLWSASAVSQLYSGFWSVGHQSISCCLISSQNVFSHFFFTFRAWCLYSSSVTTLQHYSCLWIFLQNAYNCHFYQLVMPDNGRKLKWREARYHIPSSNRDISAYRKNTYYEKTQDKEFQRASCRAGNRTLDLI